MAEIVRGQEIYCRVEVLNEIFSEEKMVVLYRFSFEIEKARNRLDLNVGAGDFYRDHVVPLHNQQNVIEPRLGGANPTYRAERFGHINEFGN